MAANIRLGILCKGRTICGQTVEMEVEEDATCREVLGKLTAEEEEEGLACSEARKGAWHLVERWNGCERRLTDEERVVEVMKWWEDQQEKEEEVQGRVWLKYVNITSSTKRITSSYKKRKKIDYLNGPLTDKKIIQLKRDLRRQRVATATSASSTWLWRLGQRRSLSGDGPLDPLREKLDQLRHQNLQLSKEISELNIKTGGLSAQLKSTREEEIGLRDSVRSVEEEVRRERREKERENQVRVADLQAEALRLRRELETRSRLNSVQESKLQSLREALETKKTKLNQQQQPVVQTHESHMTHIHRSHDHTQVATPPKSKLESQLDTPTSDGGSHTPSGSVGSGRKRKTVFETRTRLLLDAEAEQFRRQKDEGKKAQSPARKLDFASTTPKTTPPDYDSLEILPVDMIEDGRKRFLSVPQADSQWYRTNSDEPSPAAPTLPSNEIKETREVKGDTKDHAPLFGVVGGDFLGEVMASVERSVGGVRNIRQRRRKKKKRVSFTADAIILSAALEGDLATLKDCVIKLGGCKQVSPKGGATCLHNAVCSGHLASVQFLVEIGCDINAQDEDGWTPLHCAVAYSNSEVMAYLLSHGASLWLETTEERETPLRLGERELAAQREKGDERGQQAAQNCLNLLQKAHSDLRESKGGVVYSLFSRAPVEPEELILHEGERLIITGAERDEVMVEGWWEVEKSNGMKGLVPVTFLGISPRYEVSL